MTEEQATIDTPRVVKMLCDWFSECHSDKSGETQWHTILFDKDPSRAFLMYCGASLWKITYFDIKRVCGRLRYNDHDEYPTWMVEIRGGRCRGPYEAICMIAYKYHFIIDRYTEDSRYSLSRLIDSQYDMWKASMWDQFDELWDAATVDDIEQGYIEQEALMKLSK